MMQDHTHLFEVSSNMVINPYPSAKIAHETQMIGRYSPVALRMRPAAMEVTEPESENGSILSHNQLHKDAFSIVSA